MKSALIFVFSLILVFVGLAFVKPVFAQTAQSVSTAAQVSPNTVPDTNPDVAPGLHNWTQSVLLEVTSAMTCQLVGIDPTDPNAKCLGIDPQTHKIGYVNNGGGAMMVMGETMNDMFNIPVHLGDYTGYMAQNFGVAKHAYATAGCGPNPTLGIGYCGLAPLLPIWEVFRNIVYLIFVLVFMIIGIAIMLRVHIDPRTVMTIENQIPKLILGLILVTFSYAIAGFLIDAMYISIYLIYGVMSSIPGADLHLLSPQLLQGITAVGIGDKLSNSYQGVTLGSTVGFVGTIAGNLSDVIRNLLDLHTADLGNLTAIGSITDIIGILQSAFNPNAHVSFFNLLADTVSTLGAAQLANQVSTPAEVGGQFLIFGIKADLKLPVFLTAFVSFYAMIEILLRDLIPYAIPFLVILIATLWALFRLWLSLIGAYIFTLLDVATAPFWLLAGLIPGGKIGFSTWFRDIISNIAVFPVVLVMFWTAKVFIDAFGGPTVNGEYVPPLIGNPGAPNFLSAIIAIGFILSTPDILNQTKKFLKAPELDFKSVQQALSKGTGAPGRAGNIAAQVKYGTHYVEGKGLVAEGGKLGRLLRGVGAAH